MRRIEAKVYI